ncbi:hypothetical protein FTX61_09050 [Nitriliruptoraceae bacterium ZYF776]|nr:hypothetical protein [Profundirhabdus halotolerans]
MSGTEHRRHLVGRNLDPGPRTAEHGFALVSVLLVIIVVGGLAALMFGNARVENRQTGDARDYEAAVHSAEAALEAVYAWVLAGEETPAIAWAGPQPGTDAEEERAEVLRQVELLGSAAVRVGDGEDAAVAIGPFEAEDGNLYVYGVGAVAGDSSTYPDHRILRTRLADIEVGPVTETPGGQTVTFGSHALNVRSGIRVSGNVVQITGGGLSSHGAVTVRQAFGEKLRAGNLVIESGDGTVTCSDSWCPTFRQTAGHPAPIVPGVASTPVPILDARSVHRRYAAEIGERPGDGDWYDLCYPDAAQGRPHPSVHRAPTEPGAAPCTGTKIQDITGSWPTATWRGWQYQNVSVAFFSATGATQNRTVPMWTKSSGDGGYPPNGVYYAHERNVMTSDLWNTSARLSIIASADPNDARSDRGAYSGNVWWQGNSHYNFYNAGPSSFQLAVFADRDLVAQGTAKAEGVVYAREQFRSFANDFRIIGSGQAAGTPLGTAGTTPPSDVSSPGSPIHQTTDVEWGSGGSFVFNYQNYSFEVDPGDDGGSVVDPGPPQTITVRTWDEL